MKIFKSPRLFQLTLYLISLHSLLVGLALIILPFGALSWFGFTIDPYRFFSTQGGVFHIIMSLAYYLAGRTPLREKSLLLFIILAKWIAFFFLAAYFLVVEMVPVIAFSAVGDGFMGLVVMTFFLELYTKEE